MIALHSVPLNKSQLSLEVSLLLLNLLSHKASKNEEIPKSKRKGNVRGMRKVWVVLEKNQVRAERELRTKVATGEVEAVWHNGDGSV